MAQNTFADFDATSSNNSTIEGDATDGSVSVAENNLPSTVNNAIRTIMAACNLAFGDLPSGTSRPAYLTSGKFWKDTTTATSPIIKFYDGTDDITVYTIDTTANTVSILTSDGTVTLTNKTFDLASNTLTGTLAEFNTAVSDATLASLAGTETLTNKTVDLASNTVTGTLAQFNTAISDGSFTTLGQIAGFNAQTGTTYTAALADAGKAVTMNNALANTLTIPTNAAVAFPVGSWFSVIQIGAGATTVTGDTGVTVNGVSAGGAASPFKYAFLTCLKVATNEWYLNVDGVA